MHSLKRRQKNSFKTKLKTFFLDISRLVRQSHVKEELSRTNSQSDKRSPVLKTFAEAKQNLSEFPNEYDGQKVYDSQMGYEIQGTYNNEYSDLNTAFAEADEENFESYENGACSQPQLQTIEYESVTLFNIRSNEGIMMNETSPDEYSNFLKKERNKRRKSRELPANPDLPNPATSDEPRRKPEAMRSVSEDSAPKAPKVVTRRSMSHPEKESPSRQKENDNNLPPPKFLSELNKRLSPRRKAKTLDVEMKKGLDDVDTETENRRPVWRFQKVLEKRNDSKSFDQVVKQVIKSEIGDEKSQSLDDNLFSDKKKSEVSELYILRKLNLFYQFPIETDRRYLIKIQYNPLNSIFLQNFHTKKST